MRARTASADDVAQRLHRRCLLRVREWDVVSHRDGRRSSAGVLETVSPNGRPSASGKRSAAVLLP